MSYDQTHLKKSKKHQTQCLKVPILTVDGPEQVAEEVNISYSSFSKAACPH